MRRVLNLKLTFLIITYLIIWFPGFSITESLAKEDFENVNTFNAYYMIKDQKILILDVRTDVEYARSHIRDAVLIPLMVLSKRVHELKVDQRILVYSYKGNRSTTACEYLASKGFKHIYNMLGGIDLWTEEGYEVVR
jgi:rhodanese-related sulfurtransferase